METVTKIEPEPEKKLTVVAIITRYNEYIDWIQYIMNKVDFIFVYNKGPNENYFNHITLSETESAKTKFIKSPNVGRIDHTLAHHILEHWEILPDILISLPGSILMCKNKGSYLGAIMKRANKHISRYGGFYSPRFRRVQPTINYSIDEYQAEGACNRNNNPFIKSEYPDFQTWKKAIIDDRPMRYFSYRGMFAVCKENIKHINKQIYENLLQSLSVGDNIENGHFAERIWAHLFRQYSFDTKVEQTETDGNYEILCSIRNPN